MRTLLLTPSETEVLLEPDTLLPVYGGVGLAFQDAVAAWQIYRAALSHRLGREIDFLA